MASKKSDPARVERDVAGRGAPLLVPRSWVVILGVLLLLPWLAVGGLYFFRAGGAEPEARTEEPGDPTSDAKSGPWGTLTLVPIVISPPLEFVSIDWGPVQPPRWFFPGATPDTVGRLLTAAGVAGSDVARLQAAARQEPRISGVVLLPDAQWVRGLPLETRGRIYSELAKSGLNFDQAQAFRYRGATPEDWLGHAVISPATRELVRPFIYREGEYLHFADVELIRSEISDQEELRRLSKALLRQPTFIVKLEVENPPEVESLAEYWGRGGRRTDIRPLLESVAGAGPDRSIDIVHLLPAFARNFLYRYPKLSAADFERPVLANCLWSSLNFFEAHPVDRYLDVDVALETLKQEYYVIENGFELGDVVAFLDEDGDIFHAAVYLAADLLFSKNGTSPMAPWSIMSIDDVKGYYRSRSANPRLIVHRKNGF